MPRCHLTPEFLESVLDKKPSKTIHYIDKSIVGFLLEYRPSGMGTWYLRYRSPEKEQAYYKIGSTESMDALLARAYAHQLSLYLQNCGNLERRPFIQNPVQNALQTGISLKNFIIERYLPHAKIKKQTWKLDKQLLEKYVLNLSSKMSETKESAGNKLPTLKDNLTHHLRSKTVNKSPTKSLLSDESADDFCCDTSEYSENATVNLVNLSEKPLHAITHADLLKWQKSLPSRGIKACTCNRILAVVKTVFSCAVEWEELAKSQNPCKALVPFTEHEPRERKLTFKETQQLITALRELGNDKQALALLLLLYTGARKSEILTARWEYVDLENNVLTVPTSTVSASKNTAKQVRYIPLSKPAIEIIEKLAEDKNAEHSPWLFSAKKATRHLSSLYYTWDEVRTRLGLKDLRINDLRHSYANFIAHAEDVTARGKK